MPTWLGVIGALVGIVVFIGSAVQYLRGSKDAGTIKTLEQNNHALTERVTILEAGRIADREEKAALTARVESLERENSALVAERPSADVLRDIRSDVRGIREHEGENRALLIAIAQTIDPRSEK